MMYINLIFNTMLYNNKINMKTGGQMIKNQFDSRQQYTKQSNNIMRQIGSIKQAINPLSSNSKMADGGYKQKCHLPNNNASIRSREEINSDQYRQSLEKRLQKLFRYQKEMFKERQYLTSAFKGSERGQRQSHTSQKFQIIHNNSNIPFQPFSIDHMQRKIKQLQQKYKMKQTRQKQQNAKEIQKPLNNQRNIIVQKVPKSTKKYENSEIDSQKYKKQRLNSNSQLLTQTVEECIDRQRNLEGQIVQLRKQMKELKQNNQLMSEKIVNRQQKRKRKHRTRQILSNILIKLQIINNEINHVKKRPYKQDQDGRIHKIQDETRQILAQFDKLKVEYKKLQQQRKKVENRQSMLEDKLKKIHVQNKQQQVK